MSFAGKLNTEATFLSIDLYCDYVSTDTLVQMKHLKKLLVINCTMFPKQFEAAINKCDWIEEIEITYAGGRSIGGTIPCITCKQLRVLRIYNAYWHKMELSSITRFFAGLLQNNTLQTLHLSSHVVEHGTPKCVQVSETKARTMAYMISCMQLQTLELDSYAYFNQVIHGLEGLEVSKFSVGRMESLIEGRYCDISRHWKNVIELLTKIKARRIVLENILGGQLIQNCGLWVEEMIEAVPRGCEIDLGKLSVYHVSIVATMNLKNSLHREIFKESNDTWTDESRLLENTHATLLFTVDVDELLEEYEKYKPMIEFLVKNCKNYMYKEDYEQLKDSFDNDKAIKRQKV